jgi:hypothetical protein
MKGGKSSSTNITNDIQQLEETDPNNNITVITTTTTIEGNSTSITTIQRETEKLASLIQTNLNTFLKTIQSIAQASEMQSAVAAFIGTSITFLLNNQYGLNPIKASTIVGLFGSLIVQKLGLAIFCGSFAGMASTAVISCCPTSSVWKAGTLLGLLCSSLLTIFNKFQLLQGIGGRLGFIAQCSCTIQYILISLVVNKKSPFTTNEDAAKLIGGYAFPKIEILKELPPVCLYTVVGALFMSFWKEKMIERQSNTNNSSKGPLATTIYERLSNSVTAASITGLIASLLLKPSIAGPIYCGSFIAMSSPTTIQTYGGLVGASIMGGICQQAMTGILIGGWGGKLGTAALLGVISYNLFINMLTRDHKSTTTTTAMESSSPTVEP